MPVNVSMTTDIQQGHVLIISLFCEDDSQIMVNDYRPSSAHLAPERMIARRRIERVFLKQLEGMNHCGLINHRQLTKRDGELLGISKIYRRP
jgi:hypothetical protein